MGNFVPAPITPLYTFFPCDYLCFLDLAPFENIYTTPPKKKSDPDEQNFGHASDD